MSVIGFTTDNGQTQVKYDYNQLDNLPVLPEGLSAEIKLALLNCMQAVAWSTDSGQELYDALYTALNPPENLTSITAVYTQSGTIYTTDNITILRNGLVVTAHYSDNTSEQVYSYALSGTLTEGTSTITVQYAGKSTTFTVNVTDGTLIYELASPATFTGVSADIIDTGVVVEPTDRAITILMQFNAASNTPHQGFVFYTGQASSPYASIGLKAYSNPTSSSYPFVATSGSNGNVHMTNFAYGAENYLAYRYSPGDSGVSVFGYNATGGLLTGATANHNIVSDAANLILGASSTSSTSIYKGTISQFKVYSRALTDEEIYAFLNGEVA